MNYNCRDHWQFRPLICNMPANCKGVTEYAVDLHEVCVLLFTGEQGQWNFWPLITFLLSTSLFTCLIWPIVMSLVSRMKLQLKGHGFQDISEIQEQLHFPKVSSLVLPSVEEFWTYLMNSGLGYWKGTTTTSNKTKCLFHYWLAPETFRYVLVYIHS